MNYEYWCPGQALPAAFPAGCEAYDPDSGWTKDLTSLVDWKHWCRRWPKNEKRYVVTAPEGLKLCYEEQGGFIEFIHGSWRSLIPLSEFIAKLENRHGTIAGWVADNDPRRKAGGKV